MTALTRDDKEIEGATEAGEEPQTASPTRITSPAMRFEASKALVWGIVIGLLYLATTLAQSLLVIFGAMVFGTLIDGGARLLGKVLNIARGWRILMVLLATVAFLAWLGYFAGTQIATQASQFPELISKQLGDLVEFLRSRGVAISAKEVQSVTSNLFSGMGTITKALGGLFGGLTTVFLIVIIGIYLAIDPRLYERGVGWMIPASRRSAFYDTISYQAYTLRRLLAGRLLGMVAEGVFTYILLSIIGVPMAVLLGLITGLLAFIPNIGAIISGILMALVGFTGGTTMGLYTIGVYILVQNFDGYVLVPLIAKKTVDLAPALVLVGQLLLGVLFGILGLALADPILAVMKAGLERRSQRLQEQDEAEKQGAADTAEAT